MKRNQKQRETGRQEGRQWEAIKWTMGENGRQDLRETDKPSNTGSHKRRQWETRVNKTSRRRTHHPTKRNKKGDGRQGETRPYEGGYTIQDRQTRGDKTAGRRTHQGWGTIKDRHTCREIMAIQYKHILWRDNRRQGKTRRNKGRQDLGKAETPSGRQIITGIYMGNDNGRQKGETRHREGGRTIKHRHTYTETMGDKGRQNLGKTDKGRQDLGKGNTPSKTCRHTCGETRGDKGRWVDKISGRPTHHPTQAYMWGRQWATKRKDKTSKRRTHHPTRENKKGHHGRQREKPTKGNKKEYNGRQKETNPSERRTYHPTRRNKKGTIGKGDKSIGKADTPSNKGKQEGIMWETKGN